jgi:hypothetical protein
MTEPIEDAQDPIRQALRQLPRSPASGDFNRRLQDRLGRRKRRTPPWQRLAAAALLVTLAGGGIALTERALRQREQERRRAALELRQQELRRDLAALRERAARPPTLYLGSASDLDLVLDLEPWMQQPLRVQPAAYNGSRP